MKYLTLDPDLATALQMDGFPLQVLQARGSRTRLYVLTGADVLPVAQQMQQSAREFDAWQASRRTP